MKTPDNLLDSMPDGGVRICVIALGQAGIKSVDRLAASLDGVRFIAADSDATTLRASLCPEKVLLGAKLTRGMGTGADAELGRALAEEAEDQIRTIAGGHDVVFVVAGLGGGTGSGAAPFLAKICRESGALTLGVVVTPFSFESSRRHDIARSSLRELKMSADSVLSLANHRLGKLIDESQPITEVLAVSDELVAHGIRGLWQLITRRGLIPLGLPELQKAIRGRHTESAFAVAEASGEGRTQAVLDKLLKHPLLDEGRTLAEAENVIVSIVSGPELTPAEIGRIKDHVQREADKADVTVGAVCEETHAGRLSVLLVVTRRTAADKPEILVDDTAEAFGQLPSTPHGPSRFVPPPSILAGDRRSESADKSSGRRRRKRHEAQQPELALQVIPKGRFDKSEPTVHGGSDLDVPTYIRRNVSLVDFPSLS